METLTATPRYNSLPDGSDLPPDTAEQGDGDLDFYGALAFLNDSYIDEENQVQLELVNQARRGSIEDMGKLSEYVGREIGNNQSADAPDADLIAKLEQVKIALDAHIETVKQQAQLAAANLSREEESRAGTTGLALEDVLKAYPPDPNDEPTPEPVSNDDDENDGGDPSQSPEQNQDAANDKYRFYDKLFDAASIFGISNPSDMLKVDFDDLSPEQREALYVIFDNVTKNSSNSGAQALYEETQRRVNKVLEGFAPSVSEL